MYPLSRFFRNLSKLGKFPKIIQSLLLGRSVFIFQMGRVGSTSILEAIQTALNEQNTIPRQHRLPSFYNRSRSALYLDRNHTFQTDFAEYRRKVILWRTRLGLPISVICPIREPIARSVSAFFYFYYLSMAEYDPECLNIPAKDLTPLFLMNSRPLKVGDVLHDSPYKNSVISGNERAEHNFSLNWFDKHFQPQLHIDVYKKPFPIDRKWQIYRRGFTRVLLYRADLKQSEQAKLVSHFLGLKLGEIKPKNESTHRIYSKLYSQFRESVKLPEQYIRQMHDSRFARHFWSPEELKAAADKWR